MREVKGPESGMAEEKETKADMTAGMSAGPDAERTREELPDRIREVFACGETDVRTYSPLTLAYIGDAVYELVIRTVLVEQANRPVNELHTRATQYVRAQVQAGLAEALLPLLSQEEQDIYRRGRNAKSYSAAKNASLTDYRKATGLEALVGYLYLQKRMDRVLELIRTGIAGIGMRI